MKSNKVNPIETHKPNLRRHRANKPEARLANRDKLVSSGIVPITQWTPPGRYGKAIAPLPTLYGKTI